jgi:HK97 family phage portal protein
MLEKLKRLFQRKGIQPEGAVQYVFRANMQRPSWSMTQEIQEGYEQNSVVYACINLKATVAASIPWYLQRYESEGWVDVGDEQHPVLVLLRRPNPFDSGNTFRRKVFIYLDATGNNFIQANSEGVPSELLVLRPDRFAVLPNNTMTAIEQYVYSIDGNDTPYPPEQVLHLKLFETVSQEWFGLSPVRVGAMLIDSDNNATNWNRALLENRGRPDAIFNFKNGLTPAQRVEWEQWIKEKYSAAENAGRPMRIEAGDFEYIELSKTPQELDFTSTTSMTNRRICQLYNVPPELVGDPQNKTYSNQQEARLALIEQGVFPMMDLLRDALNAWLVPRYGDNLRLMYDKDAVDVVSEKRRSAFERVQAADWLSLNEQREATGYGVLEEEDADVPRALLNQRAFSAFSFGEEEEEENPEEEKPEEEEEETEETDETEEEETEEEEDEKGARPHELKVWNVESEQQKVSAYVQMEHQRRGFEQLFAIGLQKYFRAEEKKVLAAVKAAPRDKMADALRTAVHKQAPALKRLFKTMYGTVGRYFFDKTRLSIPKGAVAPEKKDVNAALRTLREFFTVEAPKQVEAVQSTTIDRLARVLRVGIFDELPDDEIVKNLQKTYEESFVPNRSEVIAGTEVVKTSNAGAMQGAKSTGLKLRKAWLSQRDSQVRRPPKSVFDHRDEAVESVELDQAFIVSGQKMMFPGDATLGASMGNIINCRCLLSYSEA